jgi:hypothetical protein
MRLEVFALIASFGVLGIFSSSPNDKLCLQLGGAENERSCKQCYDSYFDLDTSRCNSDFAYKIDRCIEYEKEVDSRIICIKCKEGSYSVDGVTCKTCSVPGCANCPNDVCEACSDRILIDYSNQKCNLENQCLLQNCNVCSALSSPACLKCNVGYSLNKISNECIKSIPFCEVIENTTSSVCSVCNPGFYITADGECVSSQGFIKENSQQRDDSAIFIIYGIIIIIVVIIKISIGCCLFGRRRNRNDDGYYMNANTQNYVH